MESRICFIAVGFISTVGGPDVAVVAEVVAVGRAKVGALGGTEVEAGRTEVELEALGGTEVEALGETAVIPEDSGSPVSAFSGRLAK